MNVEYSEAAGEVLQILKYTDKELVEKIPKMLIEFWERNAVSNSNLEIDENKKIEEINLKPKSKALLGMIYRNYWCDSEERKAFDMQLKQNEFRIQEEAREKYNPEEIFKTKVEENVTVEKFQKEVSDIVPYKENIFTKIIQKIKSLFKQ